VFLFPLQKQFPGTASAAGSASASATIQGLADPTLAMAVVDINGTGCNQDMPFMAYAGFTWPNFMIAGMGKIVEANIASGPKIASNQDQGQQLKIMTQRHCNGQQAKVAHC